MPCENAEAGKAKRAAAAAANARIRIEAPPAFCDGSNRGGLKWFLLRGQEADGAEGVRGARLKYLMCVNAHFSPSLFHKYLISLIYAKALGRTTIFASPEAGSLAVRLEGERRQGLSKTAPIWHAFQSLAASLGRPMRLGKHIGDILPGAHV